MTNHRITRTDDAPLAALIRRILKDHRLDIPGTAYFDSHLDHLSEYYNADRDARAYYVYKDGKGALAGGIGIAECDLFPECAELQKLYLAPEYTGHGEGYAMIHRIEDVARTLGYRQMYLETHSNLQAAMHIYEKAGYREIPRPDGVIHSTMDHFYLKTL